jgi:hypothetical protein
LIKHFENRINGLDSYISTNKLSVSKEKELITIFQKINK